MAKINIKAVSVISAIALATVSLISVAAAQDTQTATISEPSSDGAISVKAEVTGQAFSASWLDMENVKDEFEIDGYTQADFRDISAMQSKALPRSINSEKAKEYIYDRMLNTMDFYKSLEGSYTHTDYDDDI